MERVTKMEEELANLKSYVNKAKTARGVQTEVQSSTVEAAQGSSSATSPVPLLPSPDPVDTPTTITKHSQSESDEEVQVGQDTSFEQYEDVRQRTTKPARAKKSRMEVKEETVQCSKCSLRFPDQIMLQMHMRQLHTVQQVPTRYICTYGCSKSFGSERELRGHVEAQHPKRKCPKCNMKYVDVILMQLLNVILNVKAFKHV